MTLKYESLQQSVYCTARVAHLKGDLERDLPLLRRAGRHIAVDSSGWVGIPGLYHESISTIDDLLGVVALEERRRMWRRRERGEEG
jgi:hypothetical protein